MSTVKKFLVSVVLVCSGLNRFLFAAFPVARELTAPTRTSKLYTIHRTLAAKATPQPGSKKNFFTCAFSFLLSNGTYIDIYLSQNHIRENVTAVLKLDGALYPHPTENVLIFMSRQQNTDVQFYLSNLHHLFCEASHTDDAATRNQAMLLKTLNGRSKNLRGEWNLQVLSAMRTTDSEANAIYVLQHKFVIDNIINQLTEVLKGYTTKPQIASIEFHGFTTRDMCPLCFTNMNIIQYLCNDPTPYNPVKFSFLKYLKHKLQTERYPDGPTYAKATCSTKIFISSQKASIDNLNFIGNITGEQDNCLHQFRLPDDPSPVTTES